MYFAATVSSFENSVPGDPISLSPAFLEPEALADFACLKSASASGSMECKNTERKWDDVLEQPCLSK